MLLFKAGTVRNTPSSEYDGSLFSFSGRDKIMKKWDKSYTYAIVTVLVFALIFAVAFLADNRKYKFEGSEKIEKKLEDWDPLDAKTAEPHEIDGDILFYSVDKFSHYIFFDSYRENKEPIRRFLKSDVKSDDDIGAIAVLYYDREKINTYSNGASAFMIKCSIYILDPDTLEIMASDFVLGKDPASTTSGGDRYGSVPAIGACRSKAEKLVKDLDD